MEESVILAIVCIFGVLFCVLLPFIAIYTEKRDYNNGFCKYCGEKLRLFDFDSGGSRGYVCDKCRYHTWISYSRVDRWL